MCAKIIDLFRLSKPLKKEDKDKIFEIEAFVGKDNSKQIEVLVKTKKIGFTYSSFNLSPQIIQYRDYPQVYIKSLKDKENNFELKTFVSKTNKEIEKLARKKAFEDFSKNAHEIIPKMVAPGIVGLDSVKKAVSLQLFTKEKVHVLLLGDPGTGKTDVLRSCTDLAPKSSFGLGSGASGAGLSVTFSGEEMIKGLLPMADEGLCCIDELNLVRHDDIAALYSAMEKGFITYDKGGKHVTIDARVNVLATANPKGDKFAGWMVETIKKQLPFDAALLTRFHLVFLIRKPDVKEFEEIAKKIVKHHHEKANKNDYEFVKRYVAMSKDAEIFIPKTLENEIIEFAKKLKEKEEEFIVEINPRIVHGLIRLAKASARMSLKSEVSLEDVKKVEEIFESSLYLKK